MNIAIIGISAYPDGIRRVCKIEEDEPTSSSSIARRSSHRNTVVELLVDYDVMGTPKGQICEVTSQVLGIVEDDCWAGGVNGKKLKYSQHVLIVPRNAKLYLLHVKDLDTVVVQLATNEHVMLVGTDLVPD